MAIFCFLECYTKGLVVGSVFSTLCVWRVPGSHPGGAVHSEGGNRGSAPCVKSIGIPY